MHSAGITVKIPREKVSGIQMSGGKGPYVFEREWNVFQEIRGPKKGETREGADFRWSVHDAPAFEGRGIVY